LAEVEHELERVVADLKVVRIASFKRLGLFFVAGIPGHGDALT
jgi:hypothetical protein